MTTLITLAFSMKKYFIPIINPWFLFNSSIHLLKKNPIIFYPLGILGFIQLFILTILLLTPCHPFSDFFDPLITTLWSKEFLHYPYNLILLPKLFYYIQIPVYFLIGNFLLAVTVGIITAISRNKTIFLKQILLEASNKYIHLCCYSLASFVLFSIFSKCYSLIILGGMSPNKIYFSGSPYIQFLAGTLITSSLAYVIPIIMIEKKKILSAIFFNFKILSSSFWVTLSIVLIPSILYFPVLILRNNVGFLKSSVMPEIQILMLIPSIICTLLIDVIITIGLTTYYLDHKKDLQCLQNN